MTINVPSEIGVVLQELAAKLGVAAEVLWETVMRQMVLEGTVAAFFVGAALLVGLVLLCVAAKVHNDGSGDPGGWRVVGILLLVGAGMGAPYIMRLFNPAFYALNYILGVLR